MTPRDFYNRNDFQLSEVSAASGAHPEAIKGYLRNNVVIGHKDDAGKKKITGGGGKGRRRNFTFFNVMEFAVAVELFKTGLGGPAFPVDRAFATAAEFSHVADPPRHPGLPFPGEAVTFLAIGGAGGVICFAWRPEENPLPSLRHRLGKPTGLHLLDCSAVFARVCAAFGLEAGEVMRAAYAEGGDAG